MINVSETDGKAIIRHKVWDYLEASNIAQNPRPVHDRIPNFVSAAKCAHTLANLPVYRNAQIIKVNPDKPQEEVRFIILKTHGKSLLVPTPRLRNGLFNRIVLPVSATPKDYRQAATSMGVKLFGQSVGLDAKVKVDAIVIGSVAVSTSGIRIGKGEGFADLEFGMMMFMQAVDQNTPVITTVHDCQIVDIPERLCMSHDVPVDWIITPTRVIEVANKRPKPAGVDWLVLTNEKLQQVPILQQLRALTMEPQPPSFSTPAMDPTLEITLSNIPRSARVRDLKKYLLSLKVGKHRLQWWGAQGQASLQFNNANDAQQSKRLLLDNVEASSLFGALRID